MAILTRDQIYTPLNKRKEQSLFVETCAYHNEPIFTVRDEKEGYISLRKLYIQYVSVDPSEASFAEAVFGDVGYWLHLRENKTLKPFFDEWRVEAEVIRKSMAFKSIVEEVQTKGRSSYSAAKFLIEEPWKDKRNPKVKEESKETTSRASLQVKSDIERLQEEGLLQ